MVQSNPNSRIFCELIKYILKQMLSITLGEESKRDFQY